MYIGYFLIDNKKYYISNISPLLWTNDLNLAKRFSTESELITDLYEHQSSLEKLVMDKGQPLIILNEEKAKT